MFAIASSLCTFPTAEAASNSWVAKAQHPLPGIEAHAVAVIDGVLYTIGGLNGTDVINDTYAYYPATNSWLTRAPMPDARMDAAAAVVSSSPATIYVIGGDDITRFPAIPPTTMAYIPATNSWLLRAPMNVVRASLAAATVNGVIYAIGGHTPEGELSTNEAYHPSTDSWVLKRPMPTPRHGLVAIAVNNVIYAIGGCDEYDNPLTVVEAYYYWTNSWVRKKSLPRPAGRAAAATVENVIFLFGGLGEGVGPQNSNQAYFYRTNSWVLKAPMPTPRFRMGAGAIDNAIYVVGGTDTWSAATYNVNEAYYYR